MIDGYSREIDVLATSRQKNPVLYHPCHTYSGVPVVFYVSYTVLYVVEIKAGGVVVIE